MLAVPGGATEAYWKPADDGPVQQQNRNAAGFHRKLPAAEKPLHKQQQAGYVESVSD